MDWYYAEGGQQRGPVSEAELDNLVVAGTIRHDTLVWREGMAEWQTFGQVKGAGSSPPAAPPAMGSIVCWQCGKTFAPDQVVRLGEGWVCAACKPLYVQRLKEGAAVSGALDYAGFWIRFAAKFIDSLVLGVLVIVPIFVFGFVMAYRAARAHGNLIADPSDALLGAAGAGVENLVMNVIGLMAQVVFLSANVVYSTVFLGRYGATPGKMLCRLEVVDADGTRIGYGRGFGRGCAEILSRLICLIGYIMAAFDTQKRALHDYICSTRVVHHR